MKLDRTTRRRICSAATVPTLWLMTGCFALLVLTTSAEPNWWSSRDAVMAETVTTNSGVVTTNYAPNDYGAATQGQLKQFTARAADELNADLTNSGGAGPALSNLVYGWQQDYATNGYATNTANPDRPYKPEDLQVVNVGQLKYVAGLVYGQLYNAGYTGLYPSWIQVNTNTDNAAANLGQLKEVFDFDLSTLPPPSPSNVSIIQNSDGSISFSWSPSAGALDYLIEESQDGGATWTTVSTLGAGGITLVENADGTYTASYTLGASSAGTAGTTQYAVGASNSNGASNVTSAPPPTPTISSVLQNSDGSITFTWTGAAGATSYLLERSDNSGTNWTTIGTVTGSTGTLTDNVAASSAGTSGVSLFSIVTQPNATGSTTPPSGTGTVATPGSPVAWQSYAVIDVTGAATTNSPRQIKIGDDNQVAFDYWASAYDHEICVWNAGTITGPESAGTIYEAGPYPSDPPAGALGFWEGQLNSRGNWAYDAPYEGAMLETGSFTFSTGVFTQPADCGFGYFLAGVTALSEDNIVYSVPEGNVADGVYGSNAFGVIQNSLGQSIWGGNGYINWITSSDNSSDTDSPVDEVFSPTCHTIALAINSNSNNTSTIYTLGSRSASGGGGWQSIGTSQPPSDEFTSELYYPDGSSYWTTVASLSSPGTLNPMAINDNGGVLYDFFGTVTYSDGANTSSLALLLSTPFGQVTAEGVDNFGSGFIGENGAYLNNSGTLFFYGVNTGATVAGAPASGWFITQTTTGAGTLGQGNWPVQMAQFPTQWVNITPTGMNSSGILVGTATKASGGSSHGVMLLPVAITPSTIPTTGVARAKLVFGSGVQVPTVNPSTTQFAMTVGGQNVTNICQDQNNPNIFYFTVPPGIAGPADVTISGIQIPGMPWLSATPPQTMTLPSFVQYTSDPDTGVQGFSSSNVVSIDEAKSDIDYEVQQGMITSDQATTEFAGSRDSNDDLQGPLFEQFLAIQSPDGSALTAMAQQAEQEMNIFYTAYPLPSTPANASTGVAIYASLSDAYETGPASGMFTVTIPTAPLSALTVNYTLGGTAVNGTDYTTLSGSVVIPAGQTSAQIVVAPIQHALGGNKTVLLTLSSSVNYTINSSYNADTVTIYDYGNTVTSSMALRKNTGLAAINQPPQLRLGDLFSSQFFLGSSPHFMSINPSALFALMIGQTTPPSLPQLGTTTFFTDVQNRLTTTGSTMFYGKEILPAQNSPYDSDSGTAQVNCFVFSADKYHLDIYPTTAVGHTITTAVSDNPNASLILNGAQFAYHCLHKYLGMQLQSWSIFGGMANDNPEPFQTIGVVIHGGSVLSPTSSSPSKGSSSSWTTAQGRYWIGQSTAANNGQALSYMFGQGTPTASATPEALGGLGALICPDHTPTVVGKTPGMSGYWPIKHEKRPGYNIIGVNRATGMMIVISKDSGQPGGVWRVQPLLMASGVDFAVVTDGGGTVGCWSKTQEYLARGWRQLTTPSDIDTPTTYLIFTPNN